MISKAIDQNIIYRSLASPLQSSIFIHHYKSQIREGWISPSIAENA